MGKKFPLPPWLEHSALVKRKMKERGFKVADRVQICERCDEYAEETWSLRGAGGMGGRDIGRGTRPFRRCSRRLLLPRA